MTGFTRDQRLIHRVTRLLGGQSADLSNQPENTFSPARIATFSRFSFGGIGQLQLGL